MLEENFDIEQKTITKVSKDNNIYYAIISK